VHIAIGICHTGYADCLIFTCVALIIAYFLLFTVFFCLRGLVTFVYFAILFFNVKHNNPYRGKVYSQSIYTIP
jgi:hypothetical protein